MKKLILFLLFVSISGLIYSQSCSSCRVSSYNYLKYGELDKAKEMVDFCITCEKGKADARVWWYRGSIYQSIHTSKEYKTLSNQASEIAFESFKKALLLNFLDPAFHNLDIENKEEDLMKFYTALNDPKTKYVDDEIIMDVLMNQFPLLANILVNKGIKAYQDDKKYDEALKYFESSLFVSGMSMKIDTPVIYFAALSAEKAKNYEKAIEYFKMVIKFEYGKDEKEKAANYYFLGNIYKAQSDSAKYIKTLKEGIDKYPNGNSVLVVEMINYYLQANKAEEALAYLDLAIKATPDNPTYHFAKGSLYDTHYKDEAKALESYMKAIELDPKYFDPQYNIGALYFNTGADLLNQANEIDDPVKHKEMKEKGLNKLKESMPYLEKALELDPVNVSTLESLKSVYYRLELMDKHNEIKAKIEALKK